MVRFERAIRSTSERSVAMPQRPSSRVFDGSYRELVRLDDGTEVIVRLIRPTDKELLRRGFEHLSVKSRYLRFLSARASLTDDDLRRLTELDDATECALGAVLLDEDRERRGLGIARFARDEHSFEVAEAAVAVIDDFQGRGLGRILLHRLVEAARERGVLRFRCEFLSHNERILNMLREHAPDTRFDVDGDRVRAEIWLPSVRDADAAERAGRQGLLDRLLGQSARGTIEIRLRRLLLKEAG
jgi:GNAT superfamily N-acetyltransferase